MDTCPAYALQENVSSANHTNLNRYFVLEQLIQLTKTDFLSPSPALVNRTPTDFGPLFIPIYRVLYLNIVVITTTPCECGCGRRKLTNEKTKNAFNRSEPSVSNGPVLTFPFGITFRKRLIELRITNYSFLPTARDEKRPMNIVYNLLCHC